MWKKNPICLKKNINGFYCFPVTLINFSDFIVLFKLNEVKNSIYYISLKK